MRVKASATLQSTIKNNVSNRCRSNFRKWIVAAERTWARLGEMDAIFVPIVIKVSFYALPIVWPIAPTPVHTIYYTPPLLGGRIEYTLGKCSAFQTNTPRCVWEVAKRMKLRSSSPRWTNVLWDLEFAEVVAASIPPMRSIATATPVITSRKVAMCKCVKASFLIRMSFQAVVYIRVVAFTQFLENRPISSYSYLVIRVFYSISDIDECSRGLCKGGRCTNTPGSYICSCPTGFDVSSDGKQCIGMQPAI